MRDLTSSSLQCYSYLSLSTRKRGRVKSNATNDVKWQLKVGLHFVYCKPSKFSPFTDRQSLNPFNSILEGFLIVLFGYTSKEVKYGRTYLFAESIFSTNMKKVTGAISGG